MCFVAIAFLVALGVAVGTVEKTAPTESATEMLLITEEQYQNAADIIPEDPPQEVPFAQLPWETSNNIVFYIRPPIAEYKSQNEEIKIYISTGASLPVLFVKQATQDQELRDAVRSA